MKPSVLVTTRMPSAVMQILEESCEVDLHEGSDLTEMCNGNKLMLSSKLFHCRSDTLSNATGDTGIDFIKDQYGYLF